MRELALQSNGLWKADLKSRVVRSIYYDRKSRLLAIELRHGKIRLYRDAIEDAVIAIVNHPAPGMVYQLSPESAFGIPLSRFRPAGAMFLRRVKSAKASRTPQVIQTTGQT